MALRMYLTLSSIPRKSLYVVPPSKPGCDDTNVICRSGHERSEACFVGRKALHSTPMGAARGPKKSKEINRDEASRVRAEFEPSRV